MTARSVTLIAAALASGLALAACSRSQPAAVSSAPAATPILPATAAPPAVGAASGYSCSFQGPGAQTLLARFTLEGAGAHDDQGLVFSVLANTSTALVLAHARDETAGTPGGDIGAYVVAIDRRSLDMVQASVGLKAQVATRRGHCIAG